MPEIDQHGILLTKSGRRTGLNVDVPGHLVVVGALREVLEGSGALLATGDDRAVCCQQPFVCVWRVETWGAER